MKFRFLGDGDCPDWLLSEINTLSRLPLLSISKITKYVTEKKMNEEQIMRDIRRSGINDEDIKAVVTAIEFILTSAARNGVSRSDLNSELLQLGLPTRHCEELSNLYQKNANTLTVTLTAQSLRLSTLSSVGIVTTQKKSPVAKLALKMKTLNNDEESTTINIVKEDIPILLEELKKARSVMEGLKE